MKQIEKRIQKIEKLQRPKENVMTNLKQLYDYQNTPEGKAEFNNLYNENRYDESEQ